MPWFRDYHFHLPFYQIDSDRTLHHLYAVRVLGDLIGKSVFLFLPLYLYQVGTNFSWFESLSLTGFQKGMILVAGFFLLARIATISTAIFSGRFIHQHGTRSSLLVSYMLKAVLILLLKLMLMVPELVVVAAIFFGLYLNFFFNAYHLLFANVSMRRHLGEDLGVIHFLLQLMSVVVPALSGAVIVAWGYDAIFLFGLVGVMLGIAVVMQMETTKGGSNPSLKEFWVWIRQAAFLEKAVSFAGRYVNDATLAIWPLYVFLLLGTADKVGFLYSFSLFLALMVTFVTGLYIDHRKSNRPFFISGGILSLIWLLRINITSFWTIAIVDTFDKLTSSFHWLFYDKQFIGSGKGRKALAYFVYRELIISAAAIGLWSLVIGVFVVSNSWSTLFIIASVGVLLSLFIRETYVKQ
jgi:hypothetical protein